MKRRKEIMKILPIRKRSRIERSQMMEKESHKSVAKKRKRKRIRQIKIQTILRREITVIRKREIINPKTIKRKETILI